MTDPVVTDDGVVEIVALAIYAADPVLTFYARGPGELQGNRFLSWEELPQGQRDRVLNQARAALAASDRVVLVERIAELRNALDEAADNLGHAAKLFGDAEQEICRNTALFAERKARAALVSLDEELTK